MIKLVFSSDAAGFARSATVVASIIRRTAEPVHVRYWCTGFLPENIDVDRLKVEFFSVQEEPDNKYPGHVPPAVFNRLRVIDECPDWDRCLVMDHDMAVFCDMAEYFREDFEGNLLLGRLFGEGNTLGLQMRQRGGLPEGWKHAEEHPYFFMGPMMNLAAMREAATWDKLNRAHREIGHDEQLSLTAACDGRVRGVDKKWNIVPQWDHLEDAAAKLSNDGLEDHAGLTWHNGVPRGLIHWSEWAKPWHHQSSVWRPDLWQSERTTWEQIRLGQWDKPLALLVRCSDSHAQHTLLKRGWRVVVYGDQCSQHEKEMPYRRHPDLVFRALEDLAQGEVESADMVRVSQRGSLPGRVSGLLEGTRHLTYVGPLESTESLVGGNGVECRLHKRIDWPAGGPRPDVLEYAQAVPPCVGEEEDLLVLQEARSSTGKPRQR